MNIAIIGYGKMGKEIEKIILDEGKHNIVLRISSSNTEQFTINNLKKADVAIEFSKPELALDNVLKCFKANIPIVVGTTAWNIAKAVEICNSQNKSLFTAPNFSIGVNIFFKINKFLAEVMDKIPEYDIEMTEIHHTEKLDSPSGTAVHLANQIINISQKINNWNLGKYESNSSIPIEAIREENVPGTHSISYNSDIDKISISHKAYNRKGFAIGAIKAAEFLHNKTGYYTMEDLV